MCKVPAALVLAGLLTGCTTDRPLPDASHAGTLIEYLKVLRHETSTLLDSVVTATTAPTEDAPEYWAWGDHWCPRHVDVHSTDDVVRRVADFCAQKGGVFQEPYCAVSAPTERILFFAKFRRGIDLCQGVAATVAIQVVEPKPGMQQGIGYIDKLRTFGYRTAGDRSREAMATLEAAETERARLARELPRLRTRGTQVCMQQGGIVFLGYVEDVEGPKIKINIHGAYYGMDAHGNLGARNPEYRPETVWDQPQRWHVCE